MAQAREVASGSAGRAEGAKRAKRAKSVEGVKDARDAESKEVEEITADDLRRLGRLIGAVPVPEHLMDAVLAQVRSHRAAMRRVDEALVTRERWVEDESPQDDVDGVNGGAAR